jgi:hypothetical protein
VTAIAAGWFHSVALKDDGSVVTWGELSLASLDWGWPIMPAGLSGVTAIAAGAYHTVVLVDPIAPKIITQPSAETVRAGQNASFSVTARGYPFTFNYQWRKGGIKISGATGATYNLGPAQSSQAGAYTVVISNSAGSVTSAPPAVLTVSPASSGAVLVWGDTSSGQASVPRAALSGVTAIAAGYLHTVALKDGLVLAWGDNRSGQVTGTPSSPYYIKTASPVTLGGEVLNGVMAIVAGYLYTVALRADGSVVAWGDNGSGQTNVPIAARSGVAAIAAGHAHVLALKTDSSVVAWGDNSGGQTDVPISAQSDVIAVSAGEIYSAALKADGSVVVWGQASDGEQDVPVAAQSEVMAIAGGEWHVLALKADGSVAGWGEYDPVSTPVAAQSGVIAIAAGYMHDAALKTKGRSWRGAITVWAKRIFRARLGAGSWRLPLEGITPWRSLAQRLSASLRNR